MPFRWLVRAKERCYIGGFHSQGALFEFATDRWLTMNDPFVPVEIVGEEIIRSATDERRRPIVRVLASTREELEAVCRHKAVEP